MAIIQCDDSLAESLIDLGMVDRHTVTLGDPGATPTAIQPYVPPAPGTPDPSYTDPPWLSLLCWSLNGSGKRGAMLFGPRGSGKTTGVRVAAQRMGLRVAPPVLAYQGITIDDLRGSVALEGGSTKFIDGPLAIAVRDDCVLVIEEADRAHPSLLSALNCLTDDSGHPLTMPDGRILPVGPGFRVVLTWNPGAQYGGRGMNAALKDRLLPIYCDYPDSATETKALVARCGIGPVRANDIRKVAESIRALAGTTGFDLSLRALVTWADLLMRGVCPTWMRAFEVAILDLCASPTEDPATREALLNVAKSAGVESWR